MMYLGQLLDVINDNERVILRSSHERSLVYIDEQLVSEAKRVLTKNARQCIVSDMYSDISERNSSETVTVVYIKPNGVAIILE